ncbi:MAG: DUF6883 domain-containing protein [Candidatus Binataceae bacterium]
MKLPNAQKAVVELAKLQDYCLSAAHPEGRHKARVFPSVLGIGPADSPMLQERLMAAACDQEAVAGEFDEFGHRYVIDFPLERAGRRALVRAAWIVLTNEDFPRLTGCYVLRGL